MILRALGSLYGQATRWRRSQYARHPAKVRRLSRPVISIGNLRAGGSGKTPAVRHLAEILVARGHRPSILSRGYGRRSAEAVTIVSDGVRVLADLDAAGDEPLMLGQQLQGVPIIVSADRHAAGRIAEERFGSTVHLLDDGFQHLSLWRDIDLVIVGEDDLDEPLLPEGRLREPIEAAAVADGLIVTSTDAGRAAQVAAQLRVPTAFYMTRQIGMPRTVSDGDSVVPGQPVFAVAGIARPERFFRDLSSDGWRVAGTLAFPDHHRFRAVDVERIAQRAQSSGAAVVLTTEKDAVRLIGIKAADITIASVPLQVAIEPAGAFLDWLTEQLA